MVVSLLLVLGVSIWVSASSGYDRQEAGACITIGERLSVKGGSKSKMILKAFNIPQKDYKDEEDFFLNCEAFIGPEDESYVYEVYSIYVISLNRLCESFADNGIMLNKGWIIQKKYNEYELKEKINSIINLCDSDNDDETYLKLNSYFIMQDT